MRKNWEWKFRLNNYRERITNEKLILFIYSYSSWEIEILKCVELSTSIQRVRGLTLQTLSRFGDLIRVPGICTFTTTACSTNSNQSTKVIRKEGARETEREEIRGRTIEWRKFDVEFENLSFGIDKLARSLAPRKPPLSLSALSLYVFSFSRSRHMIANNCRIQQPFQIVSLKLLEFSQIAR